MLPSPRTEKREPKGCLLAPQHTHCPLPGHPRSSDPGGGGARPRRRLTGTWRLCPGGSGGKCVTVLVAPTPPGHVGSAGQSPGWRLGARGGEMGALGRVLLWLQLCGKRGALMGPARQRGRPRLRFPRDVGGPGPTGTTPAGGAGGVEPGVRPTAGAALLGSGAVFPAKSSVCVRESARRRSVPQFPRPEGAADSPSEHQASACLRCPPPTSLSFKNCTPALSPLSSPSRVPQDTVLVQSPPGLSPPALVL